MVEPDPAQGFATKISINWVQNSHSWQKAALLNEHSRKTSQERWRSVLNWCVGTRASPAETWFPSTLSSFVLRFYRCFSYLAHPNVSKSVVLADFLVFWVMAVSCCLEARRPSGGHSGSSFCKEAKMTSRQRLVCSDLQLSNNKTWSTLRSNFLGWREPVRGDLNLNWLNVS